MEISFEGKKALVTGASQGIGREIAKALHKCKAKVYAVARSLDKLKSLQKECPGIEIVQADLGDWKAAEKALASIDIDLLVNNAGLAILGPLVKVAEEDFDRVFAINTKAVINVTKIAINNMLCRKVPGSIVNISSQASQVGLLNHAIYCASKAAVDGFTRAAALEYGPHNIRINAVNPTVILTDMGKLGWSDPKVAKPMLEKLPLRRFGEVNEVVEPVLFLLSDKSSLITGTCLPVDAGYIAS